MKIENKGRKKERTATGAATNQPDNNNLKKDVTGTKHQTDPLAIMIWVGGHLDYTGSSLA